MNKELIESIRACMEYYGKPFHHYYGIEYVIERLEKDDTARVEEIIKHHTLTKEEMKWIDEAMEVVFCKRHNI